MIRIFSLAHVYLIMQTPRECLHAEVAFAWLTLHSLSADEQKRSLVCLMFLGNIVPRALAESLVCAPRLIYYPISLTKQP